MITTHRKEKRFSRLLAFSLAAVLSVTVTTAQAANAPSGFVVEETTIAKIQEAILAKKLTATELVKLYLARVAAYNGPGVDQPEGLLGPAKTIAHAKGVNALITLNLRPAARKAWGFDDHKARSMTDAADNDPNMPDALEVAAKLDAEFAKTGKLVGPLHGVVVAIKDQFDTFDMRTTSGADADYANDRPPHDATFTKRLRDAGAIILGKANMGEYAGGYKSSFGGIAVNPYDTERQPGSSSGGSAVAVATNLVTCAIGEETHISIRDPSRRNSAVGIMATQELVSRHGMVQIGINTHIGPIARTVEDAARILTVIAGFDPKDEMTAFAVGRMPDKPYETFTREKSLKGVRIGIVREYMDKSLFTKADEESIDIVDRAAEDLRKLGATVVDPGKDGLFTSAIRRYNPMLHNASWTKLFPELFPVDEKGKPANDHIATLVDLAFNPEKVPGKVTLRDFKAVEAAGEAKYGMNTYLRERGDSNIKTEADLIVKSRFYREGNGEPKKRTLQNNEKELALDTAVRLQRRFAIQQIVLESFAEQNLDAVIYPTSNIPSAKIDAPNEPTVNGRGTMWTFLGMQGFPVVTVPAGFTTQVYDRIRDPDAPAPAAGERAAGGEEGRTPAPTLLVGPVPAELPVGMDILGRPFSEPVLLKIAAAYEQATHHRKMPRDFGPLPAKP
ncbi:MAG: amidase [Verrucomicrobia bacterium]|nr:amidase [Verrucomicrobiota bacterium]